MPLAPRRLHCGMRSRASCSSTITSTWAGRAGAGVGCGVGPLSLSQHCSSGEVVLDVPRILPLPLLARCCWRGAVHRQPLLQPHTALRPLPRVSNNSLRHQARLAEAARTTRGTHRQELAVDEVRHRGALLQGQQRRHLAQAGGGQVHFEPHLLLARYGALQGGAGDATPGCSALPASPCLLACLLACPHVHRPHPDAPDAPPPHRRRSTGAASSSLAHVAGPAPTPTPPCDTPPQPPPLLCRARSEPHRRRSRRLPPGRMTEVGPAHGPATAAPRPRSLCAWPGPPRPPCWPPGGWWRPGSCPQPDKRGGWQRAGPRLTGACA